MVPHQGAVGLSGHRHIEPDIEDLLDAKSISEGRDERGVQEALRLLYENPPQTIVPPPFSTPAKRPAQD